MEVLDLQSLPKSALRSICSSFSTLEDVISLSSVSSILRDSCSESSAWQTLCERRWGPQALHKHLFTSPPLERCNYKALFLGVNGWRRSFSQEVHWKSSCFPSHPRRRASPPPSAAAISCSSSSEGNFQACSISPNHVINMVEIQSPRNRSTTKSERNIADVDENSNDVVTSYQSQQMPFHITSARPCSIRCIDYAQGIVAIGDIRGSLHIVHLPPLSPLDDKNNLEKSGSLESDSDEEIEVDAFIAPPTQQYPITCFEYHPPSSRLYCLWDRGECGAWRPNENGIVRIFDVENQQLITSLKEILDYYELCTLLCPNSSPSTTQDSEYFQSDGGFGGENASGNELIAGTVKLSQDRWADGACPRCHPTIPASLCWHQHRSSNAALAFFDLRAGESPGRMVNRHPLPHRSLYPRLQLVREHYVMVSHAGDPLVIWDRRFLDGGAVCSPQLVLDTFYNARSGDGGSGGEKEQVVLPKPRVSNGLYLSCYGSMLAGRADNGEIGVWDLSNILGWWNNNTDSCNSGSSSGGGDGGGGDGDVSEGLARLNLDPSRSSETENSPVNSTINGSSNWKRPVFSTYVPMAMSPSLTAWGAGGEDDEEELVNNDGGGSGMVVRPRCEVWIGPDWLAAPGQGRLHYFHL